MHRYIAPLICFFCLVIGRATVAQVPPPALTFTGTSVAVSGLDRGGRVYVFSVAREPRGYVSRVVERDVTLEDTDRDGVVSWEFPRGVPWRSIWFAVDVGSGLVIVRPHPDYPAVEIQLPPENLKKDIAGNVTQLAFPGSVVQFVVVRPGVGAWSAAVGARGPLDSGADPGTVTLATLHLFPRSGTTEAPPKHLKKGDIVLVVNSFRAEYAVATIGDSR